MISSICPSDQGKNLKNFRDENKNIFLKSKTKQTLPTSNAGPKAHRSKKLCMRV